MELLSTLMKGATLSLLAVRVVKSEALEGAPVMDVEEVFLADSKEKAPSSAFASAMDPVHPLSRYSEAT